MITIIKRAMVLIIYVLLVLPLRTAQSQKVVWDQKFDTQEALARWEPNGDISDMHIAEGVLQGKGTGTDPLIVYRPHFEIPAHAFQAIEIRMKADHSGLSQIFWSNTYNGKYSGFTGEKRNEFSVKGDNEFHTYLVFPAWQNEGKIIRFRFDPFFGANFALQSIRVLEWDIQKDEKKSLAASEGWTALQGCTNEKSPSGIRLSFSTSDSIAMHSAGGIDTGLNNLISLKVASKSARRLELLYALSDVYGLQQISIPLEADGKSHVYNVDMLSAPVWHGKLELLGIRPENAAGTTIHLDGIETGNRALGPADVRISWTGIEQTAPRTNVPMTLLTRISNTGGETAQSVKVKLKLPQGLVASDSNPPFNLAFSEEKQLRWNIKAAHPGTYQIGIDAVSNNAALHTSATVSIAPALHINPTAIPAVRPVTPEIAVGAYYFPGWKAAGSWAPITRFPERRSALGWYREGSPEVADWQIRWAVEHGVTFFAYDWYWQQGVQQLDHGLKDGLFKAKNRNLIQFCLLWANHNAEGSSSQQDILAASDFWMKEYFSRPEYLQVDGKPVVIIFSPYRFRADLTSAGVRKAYDALHQHCISAPGPGGKPLKGIYIIACVNSPEEARIAEQEGYDAASAYNWPGLGAKNAQRSAPYADLPAAYVDEWQSITKATTLPLVPPVSGGWDNRPWAGEAAFVRSDRTPALFKKHLQDAADFINMNRSKTLPMVLIEAWNEWGEGSYIEPQQQYGFGYLDAIRDVFGGKTGPHGDFTPADAGMTTPEVEFRSLDITDWDFSQKLSGWENGMQVTPLEILDGALTVRTLGPDPALFGPPVQFASSAKRFLHLRLRETASETSAGSLQQDTAQLFWSTRTSAESEDNSIRFPVKVDGEWHDITLDLSSNPHWRGVITHFRFDPGEHPGVTVQVKSLRVGAQ